MVPAQAVLEQFWSLDLQLIIDKQPVRQAVNDRGLFTAGWFGVREKYYSGWKFTIVYDQANRLVKHVSQINPEDN